MAPDTNTKVTLIFMNKAVDRTLSRYQTAHNVKKCSTVLNDEGKPQIIKLLNIVAVILCSLRGKQS